MPRDIVRKAEWSKQWYQNNKEISLRNSKKYYENNRQKIYEKQQTYKGKMMRRIGKWKRNDVKLPEDYGENWEIFYEQEYMGTTHCEECNIELTEDKLPKPTTRCLDHDHKTGFFRNILCQTCNKTRR